MFSSPAVIVHGLDDLHAALRPGRKVLILSAEGAALYAGVGWWLALMAAGRVAFPQTAFVDVLDCADAAGRAMQALRAGQRIIRLDPACPAWARVVAAAKILDAKVLAERPAALDLSHSGAARKLQS